MLKTLRTFYHFVLKRNGKSGFIFAGFILLVIIANVLSNVTPYFFKLFVQEIPSFNTQKLMAILFAYLAVNVGALFFDVISFWVGDKILFEAAVFAREKIFDHVQNLDYAFHSNKSTGGLISAFKRGDSAFFTLFLEVHHRIFEVAIGLTVMLWFFTKLNPLITVLVILSFFLTVIAAKLLIGNNIRKRSVFNNTEDNVSGIITDNLINYETVKLFAKEKWESQKLNKAFVPWLKSLWGYGNSFRLIDITIGAIINLSLFFILFTSLKGVAHLSLSVPDFVLITAFLGMFFPKLWNLVWSFRDIAKTYADIQKYFGLLDYKIEIFDPESPVKLAHPKGEIEFKNVAFSYFERRKNAIDDFSLKVRQGQAVALVGRSGSGKSTLVKLLMRFFDSDHGEITIDGVNIKNLTKTDLRSLIGVVPQEPILFNNTIAYNIGYGRPNASLGEIRAASRLANIDDFIESLPKGYQTEVGERGVKLSGGQKQRLAIARMILSDPKIIVFDEATSHLDSESERLIQEAFWKAAMGKTTIIIAHRLSTVMRADKIIVIEKGKIREVGTHHDLLQEKSGLYKHFWDLQIKLD